MNVHTILTTSGPEKKDPRTGRVARTRITIHEVLSFEKDHRSYVVAEHAGNTCLRERRFTAPGYMGDDCGRPQVAAARVLVSEWLDEPEELDLTRGLA